jgi:hypothetical protein
MNNRMPKIVLNYRPKWAKTTWKTFGEVSGRRRNRSIKAQFVMDDEAAAVDVDADEVPCIVVVL